MHVSEAMNLLWFPDDPRYQEACLAMALNAASLPGPVMLWVPNIVDNTWQLVVKKSFSLCACGRRRVMFPARIRKYFQGVAPGFKLEIDGKSLFLGMLGGDLSATLRQCRVTTQGLEVSDTPFVRSGLTETAYFQHLPLGSQVMPWNYLHQASQAGVIPFASQIGERRFIIGAVVEADMMQGTLTIQVHNGAAVVNQSGLFHQCEGV